MGNIDAVQKTIKKRPGGFNAAEIIFTVSFIRDNDVPTINLCFFCSLSSFNTGMPISTYKLIAHFSKLPDYRVHVVLPADGELAQRVRACGIQPAIIPFSRLRSPRRPGEFVRFLASYPRAFLKICFFLRKNDIAILHFSDIIDMPFYACGRLGRSTKTVAHLRHCIESLPGRLLFGLLSSLFIDRVVCISEAVFRY